MKFLFRWIFRLVVLAILLLVALLLLKDALLKEVVEDRLAAITGLEVRIDRFESRLLKPTVTIEGARLYNPAAFGGAPFLDVRQLHVEYDRPALLRGKLRLRLVRLDLRELALVQDAAGRWNYEYVNERLQVAARRGDALLKFGGIEVFNLSLDEVKRYRMTDPAKARTFRCNVRNEIFLDLRAPADLLKVGWKVLPTNALPVAPPR